MPNLAMENTLDIDNLTILEMLYYLHQSGGSALIGDPKHAFATYDSGQGILFIYAQSADCTHMISHRTEMLISALEYAQHEGASFNVCGEKVICILNDVTAHGASYGEAALRAMLKHQLTHGHVV